MNHPEPPRALRATVVTGVLASALALVLAPEPVAAQRSSPATAPRDAGMFPRLAPPGWYSGDTHEHVQTCSDEMLSVAEIVERMEEENLDVASILIWQRFLLPFTHNVCRVNGGELAISPERVLGYGVETSGLDCGRYGHLVGLGIGPGQARIAFGARDAGACEDMTGLGMEGDGTGVLNAPVARLFHTAQGAVCGYAHCVWSAGLYHPQGFDWKTKLVDTGFTTDAIHLSQEQRLSFPRKGRMFDDPGPGTIRPFFPALCPVDAILGEVDYVEATFTGETSPVPVIPPADWTAMYYKLLSAGLRISLAGGRDRACFPPPPGRTPVRTYALLDGPLSYRGWIRALARGRTTISNGNDLFLRLRLDGAESGEEVSLGGPSATASASILLRSLQPLDDRVELVVQGEVVASREVHLSRPGQIAVNFSDVPFPRSSWVAARLGSQRAHTGAIYAIVDGRPISDALTAEYWMVWLDLVLQADLESPWAGYFGSQGAEVMDSIGRARRAFRTLRDADGLDPSWQVQRLGTSVPACRGPITIGVSGPAHPGARLVFTCVNGPPQAQGTLVVARSPDLLEAPEQLLRTPDELPPEILVAVIPTSSSRSGFAEAVLTLLGSDPVLYARFIWDNPADCAADSAPSAHSASDVLELPVQ